MTNWNIDVDHQRIRTGNGPMPQICKLRGARIRGRAGRFRYFSPGVHHGSLAARLQSRSNQAW